MKSAEAFLQIEKILTDYYFATKEEHDNLGSMLGDMCTKVWKSSKKNEIISGDPAIFAEQWTDEWNEIVGKGKDATPKQVYAVAKTLLDYYTQEVEYDLGDSYNVLKKELGLN